MNRCRLNYFTLLIIPIFGLWPLVAFSEMDLLSEDKLIVAVIAGDLEAAEILLDHKHNVDVRDKNQRTPLSFAAEGGKEDFAKLLVRFNARVNASDKLGNSPLYYAASGNHAGIILMLIRAGAKPDKQNRHGLTPLMIAASQGHVYVLQTLLQAQADPTLTDYTGRSALDWAVRNARHPAARILKTAEDLK